MEPARFATTPVLDRMLLLLGYLGHTTSEERWIREHVARIEDVELFWVLAHDNRVAPWVHQQLQRLDLLDALPQAARDRFREQAERIRVANERRLSRAAHVLQALRDRDIDVVVSKGVALGEALYQDPAYKRMNDVDVFVRRGDVDTVREVYAEHGFFPIAERVGGDPERQLEVTSHLPPYVDADLSCMIGTDWDFRSPMLGHDFDVDGVWDRSRALRVAGVDVRTFGPEDTLHHLCVHLESFRTGVRDVMDIHNVAFGWDSDIDWALFSSLVERAGTHDDVYYALSMSQAHRPHPEVGRILEALRPQARRSTQRRVARRCRSERVLVRICSRQLSTIEKCVSEFNATGVLREKLPAFVAGWGSIFWPSLEDALKISATVEPSAVHVVGARVRAPMQLMRAISNEIGGVLLAGLAVKSVVDLARAAIPLGRKVDFDTYARNLGLDPVQLRTAKKQFQ